MDRFEIQGIKRNAHCSDEALESHEPTFAKKQKRYWREPLTESVSVLDIGVSELLDPLVNENSVEPCSETRSEVARTPLSDTRSDNESLNAESIVGLEPGHQGSTLVMHVEWHVQIHRVMLAAMATHWMSVMTSALVKSTLRL